MLRSPLSAPRDVELNYFPRFLQSVVVNFYQGKSEAGERPNIIDERQRNVYLPLLSKRSSFGSLQGIFADESASAEILATASFNFHSRAITLA